MINLNPPKSSNKIVTIILLVMMFTVACTTITNSPTPVPTPISSWTFVKEAEAVEENTTGDQYTIWRSNASDKKVLGQFGCKGYAPYSSKPGYAKYTIGEIPRATHLYLIVRFSKKSSETALIEVYINDEAQPRVSFYPANQGDWNKFGETERLDLGSIEAGSHTLRFQTVGQQYGVADLDMFTLTEE